MKPTAEEKLTIGAVLAAARKKRGIPIEQAAKETRIRAVRLREMEQDDFSQIDNASYARMFLVAYAKFLGIPREALDDFLPEQGVPGPENYEYISHGTSGLIPTIRHQPKPPPNPRRKLIMSAIAVVVAVLVIVGGTFAIYLAINLPRIASAFSEDPSAMNPDALPVVDTKPVLPPGLETIQIAAFERTVRFSVVDIANPQPSPELGTIGERDENETLIAPSAPESTDAGISLSADEFREDMEFLLSTPSTVPPGDRDTPQ